MVKMKAFIALTGYMLRHKQQVAQSLFSSRYLLFGRTKNCISLICTSLMLFFMFSAMSESQASVSDVVLNQKKAVVTIYVSSQDKEKSIAGSGFIIDSDGIVITNYHVISSSIKDNGSSILVRTYTKAYYVVEDILAFDEERDLAILKLAASELPATRLAVKYQPKQGEQIVVIGSPLGLETTVTDGIISSIRGKSQLLQITAAISSGSSGSPVFNTKGEVIGVATFLLKGGQSLNFALPVSLVQDLLDNPEKRSKSEGSAQTNPSTTIDDHKPNPAQSQTSIPSDWTFFTMGVDKDAALFYSPESVHTSGNKVELMVKWTHLQKQGPTYSNSQKIIKLALGNLIIRFLMVLASSHSIVLAV
jgi:S1-C subfamily serine protease